MLTQYTFELHPHRPASLRPELAYRLYAALLSQAPPEFGALAHMEGATPLSQYLRVQDGHLLWTVSLLGCRGEETLGPTLEVLERLFIERESLDLTAELLEKRSVAGVEELFEDSGGTHRLEFRTVSAFKSRGRYVNLPTPRLILQSLIKKWNGCVTECPIEDEGGGLEAMAEGLSFRYFSLRSGVFRLKGAVIPGFLGTLEVDNRLRGFHRELAGALLSFAGFAGVGIKTTLGMGGVEDTVIP